MRPYPCHMHGRPALQGPRDRWAPGSRLRPYIRTVGEAAATSLSLMEPADRALLAASRSKRPRQGRAFRSRSNLSRERIILIGEVPNARTRAVYHRRPQVRVAVPGDTGQRRLPSRHDRRIYVNARGHNSFAVVCPLALIDNAFYPVLVHRLAVSLHASSPRFLPTIGHPHAVALRSL